VVRYDYERACSIGRIIGSLKHLVEELVVSDPQFKAVKALIEARSISEVALLVIANSLVSYQLNTTGEHYWSEFSRYFTNRSRSVSVDEIVEFMSSTGLNTRLIQQKSSRLARFFSSSIAGQLRRDGLKYCSSLGELYNGLQAIYGGEYSKTVSFAVKMYSYMCRELGLRVDASSIPPPLDLRNALLLVSSCIARECSANSLSECIREVMNRRSRRQAVEALKKMCECSGLDCLELDTFTWLITGVLRDTGFNEYESRIAIKSRLGIDVPLEVLRELKLCARGRPNE